MSGHFQGMAASTRAPQWVPVWLNGESHTKRRCHRALGEGGAAVGCQGIMHKPCGWHNVAFISLTMQRGDRRNNPDSVTKVLRRVQASLMKMNWRGESALHGCRLCHIHIHGLEGQLLGTTHPTQRWQRYGSANPHLGWGVLNVWNFQGEMYSFAC